MMSTDLLNWTTRGVFGGAYNKVVRWSFEKQGVWRAEGKPVTEPGEAPAVDIYIDDGRQGEYGFLPSYWDHAGVWNRLAADGGAEHEQPRAGQTNYAYVKVRNRGTAAAAGLTVRGYQGSAGSGLVWPADFAPLDTTTLAFTGALEPDHGGEAILGPFLWTPAPGRSDEVCLLMVAEASGDSSNLVHFSAGEAIEDWRLTPNDNNIAQRAMRPVQ
jgi:hypothetical protein